jgi:hypothetical protein
LVRGPLPLRAQLVNTRGALWAWGACTLRPGDACALRTSGRASVAELIGRARLTGQALRSCTALLGKALSGRARRTLSAKLATWPCATLASSGLAGSALSGSALSGSALSSAALLELRIAARSVAELLGLTRPTGWCAALTDATLANSALSTLSRPALLSGAALLQLRIAAGSITELLRLTAGTLATLHWATTLAWAATLAALGRRTLSALLSLLELGAALPAELLRLAWLPTLLAALTTLLAALLPSRALSTLAARSLVERLAALLRLLPAGLAFVLLALVLRVFALGNDQATVSSTGAVQRDAQLRNRNRRHQGAGEQDITKLLQLPDRFEWQVALLRFFERRIPLMRSCRPDRGIISAPLRPDFGTQTQRFPMNSSSGLRSTLINQTEPRRCDSAPRDPSYRGAHRDR